MAVIDLTIEKEFVSVVTSWPLKYDSYTKLSFWMTKKLAVSLFSSQAIPSSSGAIWPQLDPSGQGWGFEDAGMVRT